MIDFRALNVSKETILTLVIGLAGAGLATYAGLPAAALLGSSLFVFLGSCCKVTSPIPAGFRTIAFAVIGCSLGSGLNENFFDQVRHWPLSLSILTISIVIIMLSGMWILKRFCGYPSETAILATSPGALAYTLSITAEGVGDARTIVVIQSIRLLGLIIVLPLLLNLLSGGAEGNIGGGTANETMDTLGFVIVFLLTLGIGRFFEKLNVPSAYLLTGTLISGAAHVMGLVSGRPDTAILFIGFTITGTVVGSRFTSISIQDMKVLLKVSLISLLSASAISALFAYITSSILSVSFGEIYVAYAPGGVEAMAAMALSLGYDPAFVAGHHLFRIALLFLLIPLFLKLSNKRLQT